MDATVGGAMTKIGLYLGIAFVMVAALYFVTETIKQRGRDEIRAAVALQSAEAIQAAASHAAETTRIMQERADAAERELASATAELEELRNERIRTGGDFVVFGNDWDDWLRGKRAARASR